MKIIQREILVSGEDAHDFLQGQLTNDISALGPDNAQLAAWCSPKGRAIALFSVRVTADAYVLTAADELVDALLKRLTMFRFRSKVQFAPAPDTIDSKLVEMIRQGVPWIGLSQSEKFTPHMLNLDLLGAISFEKGCYTGQEIVARTHYKGATKRRLFRYRTDSTVADGDKITDGSRAIGEVLNAADSELLAILPVKASRQTLFVNEQPLELLALPYVVE